MHQSGSDAPGASGKSSSNLEASTSHRSARDAAAVASPGISALLEVQIQGSTFQTKDPHRIHSVDQGNGGAKSALGSRTDPRRIIKVGASRQQTYDPEISETGAYDSTKSPELEDLPAQPCQRDLGLRLSPSH